MTTTAEAPPAAAFEAGFRAALQAAQEEWEGREHRGRQIGPSLPRFRAALRALLKSYCVRPMPGAFSRLEPVIVEIAERLAGILKYAAETERSPNIVDHAGFSGSLEVLEERLATVGKKSYLREDLESLLKLPHMSAEQIAKMSGEPIKKVREEAEKRGISLRAGVSMPERDKRETKRPEVIDAASPRLGDLLAEIEQLAANTEP